MIDHKHTPGCGHSGNSLQEALELLAKQPVPQRIISDKHERRTLFMQDFQSIGRAVRNVAEQRFRQAYITSAEVAERVGVSRAAVALARAAGHLPNGFELGPGLPVLWERAALEPHLEAWCKLRKVRADRKGAKWTDEEKAACAGCESECGTCVYDRNRGA